MIKVVSPPVKRNLPIECGAFQCPNSTGKCTVLVRVDRTFNTKKIASIMIGCPSMQDANSCESLGRLGAACGWKALDEFSAQVVGREFDDLGSIPRFIEAGIRLIELRKL